eukprot:TRINITY_DN35150_c0_g2_i1.p1 TRINITY_DN35150_c0_g2~~TRINITY_DN35150_c0_g2_i1.p1  ORF type:complete len:214 (-),score=36.81 TRINITY_DN35150_c0_g2_i1:284-925(-)
MIGRPPRSTLSSSSAASDVYKRQSAGRSADHVAAPGVEDGRREAPGGKHASRATREAMRNADLVLEAWLYIGGSMAAGSRAALQALGVRWVLNCCERIPFASSKTHNLVLKGFFDQKSREFSPFLPAAFEFLDRAKESGQCVLVHCMVGASRSASIVLAYMLREGWTLSEAWELVRARRSVARPNRGFAAQLIAREVALLGQPSMSLADFGYQ